MTTGTLEGKTETNGCEAGFTLVELLVSLAVLALLTSFIASGLTFGARMADRTLLASRDFEEVRAVQSVLLEGLSHTYPKTLGEGRERLIDFEGNRSGLAYWSKLPPAFGKSGYVRTEIRTETFRSGKALVMAWCFENKSPCIEKPLLEGIASFEVTYFDAERQTRLASWKGRRALPGLLSIKVVFPEGDERQWPDLWVRPRIDQAASCRFDPVSKRCR